MRILIIDDTVELTRFVSDSLRANGYETSVASNAAAGERLLNSWQPDLILLDILMPGTMSGLDLVRDLRRRSNQVPVILMSACGEDVDKVLGLEYADDYVVKPFSISEMIARIRAVTRRIGARPSEPPTGAITAGELCIDQETCTATFAGRPLALTPTEYRLLAHLAAHPGRVFSRDAITNHLWGQGVWKDPHALNMHIRGIRAKLEEDPSRPKHLLTVRGMGFRYIP